MFKFGDWCQIFSQLRKKKEEQKCEGKKRAISFWELQMSLSWSHSKDGFVLISDKPHIIMTKCVLWFLWKTFTRNMLKNSLTNPGTDWRPPKGANNTDSKSIRPRPRLSSSLSIHIGSAVWTGYTTLSSHLGTSWGESPWHSKQHPSLSLEELCNIHFISRCTLTHLYARYGVSGLKVLNIYGYTVTFLSSLIGYFPYIVIHRNTNISCDAIWFLQHSRHVMLNH